MGKKIVFKTYQQHQMSLLPPSLDELISEKHPVRIVNSIVDQIELSALEKSYAGGGASSYHPRMLLKVMIYSYLNNVYSSRVMERQLQENIHYMWLSGMSKPDHNTINRFRSERLSKSLQIIFTQVVALMVEQGLVDLKQVYTDGTKLEANANKFSFIWGKSIVRNKERIAQQLRELWDYTQRVAREELQEPEPPDFDPVDPAKVKKTLERIHQALRSTPQSDKKKVQKARYGLNHWPASLEKYQQQERLMEGRNSMSKTDPDATFMRMKEDYMKNGQLKPGYNLQISTQQQYILCYSLHQDRSDSKTLPIHLDKFKQLHGKLPIDLTADAGYGSLENYALLEKENINAYVKYSGFDKEQSGKINPYHSSNFQYLPDQDTYACPKGNPMHKIGIVNDNGRIITHYQAEGCQECPLRNACYKAQSPNRIIKVDNIFRAYARKAATLLRSEQGIKHRKRRCIDVEPTFANLKHNKKFKRVSLRGIKKVEIEIGLLALAHNFKKWAA